MTLRTIKTYPRRGGAKEGYSKARPDEAWWYWFTPTRNSPKGYVWGESYAVPVGLDENANEFGVQRGRDRFTVDQMHGYFCRIRQERLSDQLPRKPGYYWFEAAGDATGDPGILQVREEASGRLSARIPGMDVWYEVGHLNGSWAGPLIPPDLDS